MTKHSTHNLAAVPHVEQFFGVWAMWESQFNSLKSYAQQINLQVHMSGAKPEAVDALARGGSVDVDVDDGIAHIELSGTLMKHVSSLSANTSMAMARRQVRAAAGDDRVRGILLHIDSPGGTVAGTADLADDIAAAAKQKPVHAYIEDLGASAAYWLASQATRVSANATALVGSIGVFLAVTDFSLYAEKEGIKVHVVRFGEHKGAGVAGTEITEEQLAEWQSRVDAFGADFVAAVAAGRGISQAAAKQLADGRVHKAGDAEQLGLIDAVESIDDALSALIAAGAKPKPRTKTMSKETDRADEKQPTFAEQLAERRKAIAAACAGASDDFLNSQVADAEATPASAAAAYMKQLAAERDEAREKLALLEKEQKASSEKTKGKAAGLKDRANDDGKDYADAAAEFRRLVNAKVEAGIPRHKAAQQVARENPGLREAAVAAAN